MVSPTQKCFSSLLHPTISACGPFAAIYHCCKISKFKDLKSVQHPKIQLPLGKPFKKQTSQPVDQRRFSCVSTRNCQHVSVFLCCWSHSSRPHQSVTMNTIHYVIEFRDIFYPWGAPRWTLPLTWYVMSTWSAQLMQNFQFLRYYFGTFYLECMPSDTMDGYLIIFCSQCHYPSGKVLPTSTYMI